MVRLRHLQALEAVVSTGSLTRAAAALGVTQPAISRMIMELEEDVGFRMLDRQRGRAALTAPGRRIYEEAAKALSAMRHVDELAAELGRKDQRRIRVVAMAGLPTNIIARTIRSFAPLYPGVQVSMLSSYRTVMEATIAAGQFDFALATLPISVPSARITPLAVLPAVCLLPADHPLATRTVIHPEDLRDVPFISQGRDAVVRRMVDQVFERLQIPRGLNYEIHDGDVLTELVASGIGVAVTHRPFRRTNVANVVVRPFEPIIPIEYAMLRSRTLVGEGWMQTFARLLAQHARRAILGG